MKAHRSGEDFVFASVTEKRDRLLWNVIGKEIERVLRNAISGGGHHTTPHHTTPHHTTGQNRTGQDRTGQEITGKNITGQNGTRQKNIQQTK